MKHIKSFTNFLNESINADTEKVNKLIFDNLDPYDGIGGGECHDIALIAYTYCQSTGFLENPKILWTGNHAWVEGEYQGINCVLDVVAVNQKHLGAAFKLADDKDGPYYNNPKTSTDAKSYVAGNRGVNISVEDAEYGIEELSFLDEYIN